MAKLKYSTGFKTLDKELKKDRYAGIIESFNNENHGRDHNDGYWIYTEGYCVQGEDGLHTVHEWTIQELIQSLRTIRPCHCKECENNQTIWTEDRIHKNA